MRKDRILHSGFLIAIRPRFFAHLAGVGQVAIRGLSDPSWLTVYIIALITCAVMKAASMNSLFGQSISCLRRLFMRIDIEKLLASASLRNGIYGYTMG